MGNQLGGIVELRWMFGKMGGRLVWFEKKFLKVFWDRRMWAS
jgi:hypothetical protein